MFGIFTSKDNTIEISENYHPPEVRRSVRYNSIDNARAPNTYKTSIDKYDYMIVFHRDDSPKVKGRDNEEEEKEEENNERFSIFGLAKNVSRKTISWPNAELIWHHIVPGKDEVKENAVYDLAERWEALTDEYPTRDSMIDIKSWKNIVRQYVIDQLYKKSGLHLNSFTKGKYIYYRIRAPIKLLELQAKREGYRLQFKGEIDPGSEFFWNREIEGKAVELEEDRIRYPRDQANIILERLLRAGKISPIDLGVNIHKETMAMWSRRIHALERIADKVPVLNNYPAYAPFTAESHLRYLYQMYPSVRGKTLFRAKDRLYLTKAIIDRYFDMGLLQENGLIECFMALHDANRGEKLTIDILQRRWSTFWRVSAYEVGSPLVTHEAYEEDKPLSWFLRPFAQPLSNIREYFGEQLALHYAWLGCYTYSLCIPAILGSAFELFYHFYSVTIENTTINILPLLFLVIMVIWSANFKSGWLIQEKAIALKWGTLGFVDVEKDRPQFAGDPEQPFTRSFVNNRKVTYFPEEVRKGRVLISFAIVFSSVTLLIALVAAVYYLEYYLTTERGYWWGSTLCSLISAIQIRVLSYFYGQLAEALNDWENHRTQTEFEDNLIFKTFFFELFNSFAALTYTCFFKGSLCTNQDCLADLQSLLIFIYGLRYAVHILELLIPAVISLVTYLQNYLQEWYQYLQGGEEVTGELLATQKYLSKADQLPLLEFALSPDKGTYPKYAEVVLQYGYLMLFASAWPLIFLLSLLDNLLLMRTRALQQCTQLRRPDVTLSEDMGMWKDITNAIGILGIFFNVAIFCFTGHRMSSFGLLEKIVFVLCSSQALVIFKLTLRFSMSGTPKWISDVTARQKYMVSKYLYGYDDDNIDFNNTTSSSSTSTTTSAERKSSHLEGSSSPSAQQYAEVLEDQVDVDGLSLYDFRTSKLTRLEHQKDEQLQRQRRMLLIDLNNAKLALKDAYTSENFDDSTGIGKSKDGKPLGLLKIVLKRITFIDKSLCNSSTAKLKVSIAKVGSSSNSNSNSVNSRGDPLSQNRITTDDDDDDETIHRIRLSVESRNIELPSYHTAERSLQIDEYLSPLSPILEKTGIVTFELIDEDDEFVFATATVDLLTLVNQDPHHIKLPMMEELGVSTHHHLLGGMTIDLRQPPATCILEVELTFLYSTISRIRDKLLIIKENLDNVEGELARLKIGKVSQSFSVQR